MGMFLTITRRAYRVYHHHHIKSNFKIDYDQLLVAACVHAGDQIQFSYNQKVDFYAAVY